MAKPREPGGPTARESKSALLEAAQAAIADKRAGPGSARFDRPRGSRAPFRVLLGVAIIAGGVILGLRPSWLVGPTLPHESPAIETASATLALVEAVSRVQAFMQTRGTLPGSLTEAGITNPDIAYRRLSRDTFEVRVASGDSILTLRSTDQLQPVVVRAIRTLEGRS